MLTGGRLFVDAARDAIQTNDSFRLKEASISLTAGDDGIQVKQEDGSFYMASGQLSVHSADDAIHAAGEVRVEGGELELTAGDDAIHSDTAVWIAGGTLWISQCQEGIEAVSITIEDGEITIYSNDDGLNASGGERI